MNHGNVRKNTKIVRIPQVTTVISRAVRRHIIKVKNIDWWFSELELLMGAEILSAVPF
jgi:hypothetical protein